jgi:hypothetical protein
MDSNRLRTPLYKMKNASKANFPELIQVKVSLL